MRTFVRYSLALAATAALAMGSGPVFGQNPSSPDSGSAAQPQRSIQLVQAKAQLKTTLDAKKAKQGEAVSAKLADDVQIPNAQALPKNTVLEGHVDQVQPSQNRSDSTVVVTFDKAKLKDGSELPIKATVVSISEPANAFQANQGGASAQPGMMPGAGPAPASGGGPGGAAGGASSMPSAQPQPMPEEGGAGAVQQAQQTGKQGVPGVMLVSDIHQQTSATFTSRGKNVKVPDGTEMQVALAVIPPGVHIQ